MNDGLGRAEKVMTENRKRKRDETESIKQRFPVLEAENVRLNATVARLTQDNENLVRQAGNPIVNAELTEEVARLTAANATLARELRQAKAGRDALREKLRRPSHTPSEHSSQASDELSEDGRMERSLLNAERRAAAAERESNRLRQQVDRGGQNAAVIQIVAAPGVGVGAAPALPTPSDQWLNRLSNHHSFRNDAGQVTYKSQNRDVGNDGIRSLEQHWDQDDKLVSKPPVGPVLKKLFYSMGGKIDDNGDAVIGRGNHQKRFADAEFIRDDEVTRRENSPEQSEREWKFSDKVYYDVQYQDHKDAEKQGMKLEFKSTAAAGLWKDKPSFRNITALMCCDSADVDRRSLASRWNVLNMDTGLPKSREEGARLHEDNARAHRERANSHER